MVERSSWGRTLRAHRTRSGLTQEALAARSYVSVRTIRNIESGRIAMPRFSTLRALVDALGLGADERADLLTAGGAVHGAPPADVADTASSQTRTVPLPLFRLVGRDGELHDLVALVASRANRLVTLTGIAGIGKTRLALAAARELQGRWPRVWWVPLAPLAEDRFVVDAISEATGGRPEGIARLATRLDETDTLLVLDNLEHLQQAAADVVGVLLDQAPRLTILAASRRPVGLPGEQEWPVQPLTIPPPDADTDLDRLQAYPSVALLVERIRLTMPGFRVGADTARAVAEVCRLVDGLPLALELAAAQWRALGSRGVREAIARNALDLRRQGTSEGVHTSLRTALRASVDLLDDTARQALGCLSVFAGPATVEAAVAVIAQPSALADLDRLAAHGLLVVDDHGEERRFGMLDTIRAFARDEAQQGGILAGAAARHAHHFAKVAAGCARDLHRGKAEEAVPRLDADRDNVRAALTWFQSHDLAVGLTMANDLYKYWYFRSRAEEGLGWFEVLLTDPPTGKTTAQARLLASNLALTAGLPDRAEPLAEQSLADYRQFPDPWGLTSALITRVIVAQYQRRPAEALRRVEPALDAVQESGAPDPLCNLSGHQCAVLADLGRLEEAETVARRGLDAATGGDLPFRRVELTLHLAEIIRLQGRLDEALIRLRSAEAQLLAIGHLDYEAAWYTNESVTLVGLGRSCDAREPAARARVAADRSATHYATGRSLWAEAELALAAGNAGIAAATARRALHHIRRTPALRTELELLAVVAAASDDEEAHGARAEANAFVTHYGITTPPTIQQRLS